VKELEVPKSAEKEAKQAVRCSSLRSSTPLLPFYSSPATSHHLSPSSALSIIETGQQGVMETEVRNGWYLPSISDHCLLLLDDHFTHFLSSHSSSHSSQPSCSPSSSPLTLLLHTRNHLILSSLSTSSSSATHCADEASDEDEESEEEEEVKPKKKVEVRSI
jgi:hypothetical protein